MFDQICYSAVIYSISRHLVLIRHIYAVSKLRTSDYLDKYHDLHLPVQQIYRGIDKFHAMQKEFVQQISFVHTKKILEGDKCGIL